MLACECHKSEIVADAVESIPSLRSKSQSLLGWWITCSFMLLAFKPGNYDCQYNCKWLSLHDTLLDYCYAEIFWAFQRWGLS